MEIKKNVQTDAPAPSPAPVFKIDGIDYPADSLSDNTKALIRTLHTADREAAQLEAQLTLVRIARQTVANSLKAELAAKKAAEEK